MAANRVCVRLQQRQQRKPRGGGRWRTKRNSRAVTPSQQETSGLDEKGATDGRMGRQNSATARARQVRCDRRLLCRPLGVEAVNRGGQSAEGGALGRAVGKRNGKREMGARQTLVRTWEIKLWGPAGTANPGQESVGSCIGSCSTAAPCLPLDAAPGALVQAPLTFLGHTAES
jgi:hypothetical protein